MNHAKKRQTRPDLPTLTKNDTEICVYSGYYSIEAMGLLIDHINPIRTITSLDISYCKFSEDAMIALIDALPNLMITKFLFRKNQLTVGSNLLMNAIKRNPSIKVLHINNNTYISMAYIPGFSVFKTSNNLSTLSLRGNQIETGESLSSVMTIIKLSPLMTHLDLSENHICPRGSELLAKVLASNTSIICFDISDNFVGNYGATKFANMIKINTTLVSFNASKCRISSRGTKKLANALEQNLSIILFNVTHNHGTTEPPTKTYLDRNIDLDPLRRKSIYCGLLCILRSSTVAPQYKIDKYVRKKIAGEIFKMQNDRRWLDLLIK